MSCWICLLNNLQPNALVLMATTCIHYWWNNTMKLFSAHDVVVDIFGHEMGKYDFVYVCRRFLSGWIHQNSTSRYVHMNWRLGARWKLWEDLVSTTYFKPDDCIAVASVDLIDASVSIHVINVKNNLSLAIRESRNNLQHARFFSTGLSNIDNFKVVLIYLKAAMSNHVWNRKVLCVYISCTIRVSPSLVTLIFLPKALAGSSVLAGSLLVRRSLSTYNTKPHMVLKVWCARVWDFKAPRAQEAQCPIGDFDYIAHYVCKCGSNRFKGISWG